MGGGGKKPMSSIGGVQSKSAMAHYIEQNTHAHYFSNYGTLKTNSRLSETIKKSQYKLIK